jgi:hypothetical protein
MHVSSSLSLSTIVPNSAPNRVADLRYQNVSDYDHIALQMGSDPMPSDKQCCTNIQQLLATYSIVGDMNVLYSVGILQGIDSISPFDHPSTDDMPSS